MKNFMKKAAAAMIAMLAVVAVFGTSVPAQAASKAPKSLSVKVTTKTVDIKGKSTISVKSVKPANASKAVTYKSSNKKIATVSSKGVVTGKKAGKVNITVTSKKNKKVKKVVKITVKNLKPSSVKVSASKATVAVGKINTLKAAVKPAGVYCPVKWTSSNKAVATVSSNGKVTAKKAGTATITVKATQKNSKGKYLSTTCKVTVVDFATATTTQVKEYAKSASDNKVLVDARLTDAYQGWALDGVSKGGHIKNSVNVSSQWMTAGFSSQSAENSTREDYIEQELKAIGVTTAKSYVIYDTNGKDAATVAAYLQKKGYKDLSIYNAKSAINKGTFTMESYKNYDLYVPAEVVKNVSDHVTKNTALSSEAKKVTGGSNIVILDVAWGDETNNPDTGSGYEDAHVPGSVHVNTDEYETPKVYVPEKDEAYRSEWRLNDDATLLKLAADKGVTKDSSVIIVGSEPMATTRMGVILKYLGCEDVHVMSEGMVGWNAKGYEMEKGINKPKAVASFGTDKPLHPEYIDTISEAKELLKDDNVQLVDTRTQEEWDGKSSGYSYHDLKGRIEGSVFGPSGRGYSSSMIYYRNADKSMRSKEGLETLWKSQGIDVSKHLSFFCGSGWRAAETMWDALVLGYDNVSLYSDGWIGWSNEGNPYIDANGNKVFYNKNTNSVETTAASVSKQQVYVSPEWLKSAMSGLQKGYENVFVSEVAWGDTAGDKNYNAGHIPGAYHINSDAVEYDDCDPWPYGDGKDDFGLYDEKDVKPEDNFNIRSGKQLSEFLKRNGITKDTKVVLYGRSASDSSVTRVAFAMLYAGVEDVKVVDGGMQAWKAAGYDVETKVNEQKAGGDNYSFGTTVPAHPEYILSAEDAKDKLQNDANFRLVSIRSTKEFEGEETGYGYIDYAGEPLGAVWGHNTDDGSYVENGKVVGIDKVKSILAESDSSLDNELSFYCGTGWRATIPFLICYQNGVKNISVYDGGWWLWQLNWQKDKAAWPIQDVSADVVKNYAQLSFAAEEVNKDASGKMLVAGASAAENKLACWPARVSSKVVYGSSDKKVATVDATGKVTAVAAGEATITARTKAGNKATYKVVVSPAQ